MGELAQKADKVERHLRTLWGTLGEAQCLRVLAFGELRYQPGAGVGQCGKGSGEGTLG